jgi:hypothetical protein
VYDFVGVSRMALAPSAERNVIVSRPSLVKLGLRGSSSKTISVTRSGLSKIGLKPRSIRTVITDIIEFVVTSLNRVVTVLWRDE